jgi:multidrug efflux system outer membrane protein
MRKLGLLLAATAVISGCSFAPPHHPPTLPTPGVYPPDYGAEQPGRNATEIGWQDFFTDPRLQRLIALALENNRDLRSAVARIDQARGQYQVQGADRFPTLDGTGSYTKSRTPTSTFVQGVGTTGGVTGVTQEVYRVGIGVTSFELDFWGRVRNMTEAARSRYLSTVGAERAFRLSLIRDVAINYLKAREQAERIVIAESTVESREKGLLIAKKRLDAGVTSALDYRQSETLLTQAQTELASLKLERAQTRNFTYVLVGAPVPPDLPEPLPMADQGIIRDIGAGLPSALLVNRPDIISAEETLRAAEADIGVARAAFFPSITLTGSYGFASTQLDGLVGKDNRSWSFGPSINLPIFDWGRRTGDLKASKAAAEIALAAYEKAIQSAFREVADGLAGRRFLAEELVAQQRSLDAQRSLANLARLRYENGVAQYIEVLDAERNRFSAEQAMVSLRSSELQNLIGLYVALGGGLGQPQPLRKR